MITKEQVLPAWALAANIPQGKGHPLCRPETFGKGVAWSHCPVCRGRLHNPLCAIPKNYEIDCCKDRHDRLVALGYTQGLDDASEPMSWD